MMVTTAPDGGPPRLRGKPCDNVAGADGKPLLRGGFVAGRGRPTLRAATIADFCAPVASPKRGDQSRGGFVLFSQYAAALNDDDDHTNKNDNDNDNNNNDNVTSATYIGDNHLICRTKCCSTSNTPSNSATTTARRGENPLKRSSNVALLALDAFPSVEVWPALKSQINTATAVSVK